MPLAMLAYVFWHRPTPDVEVARYEDGLVALHASLAAARPAGFRGSASFGRAQQPWFDGYEDWYLIDDWVALGALNDAAPGHASHDVLAERSEAGTGAVYALVAGTPDLSAVRTAHWSDDPVDGTVTWRRQLVLGPAPQYAAHSATAGGERVAGAFRRSVRLVGG